MTSPQPAPQAGDSLALDVRRRRRAALAICALALASAAGWYGWHWWRTPGPPEVRLVDPDPFVQEAIEQARSGVRKAPRSAGSWGQLGMVLMAQQILPEAETCLARALELDPQDCRWAYLHARLVLLHDLDGGMQQLTHAADLCADSPVPRLVLGELLFEQGRLDEAEAQFRQVLHLDPANARAEQGLGRVAYARRDWQQALEHLSRSLERAPSVRASHTLLAEVFFRLGREAEAKREKRLAEELTDLPWLDPYMEAVDRLKTGVEARLAVAADLVSAGQVQQAVAYLQETVHKRPDAQTAHLAYGRLLLETGRAAAAEQELREAVRLRPDSIEAQYDLGQVLQQQGKLREAAACYRKVIELKPQHALAFYNLGLCLHQQGDRPGAIEALRKAILYKPEFAEAHRDLGNLLAQLGQRAEALECLQTALRLAPADKQAAQLLAKIRGSR
jgi:tetratricopeptide (TPR) repeat protein